MTSPSQALQFPRLDQAAVESSIAEQEAQLAGTEVKTRSQMMLEGLEADEARLVKEQRYMRSEIARLKGNLQKLNGILEVMEQNEADLSVQLSIVLNSVQMLKQAGVQL